MTFIQEYAIAQFGKRTVKKLAKKGITLVSAHNMPNAETGSYANGETGYLLDDNGTGRMRNYLQVLEIANS